MGGTSKFSVWRVLQYKIYMTHINRKKKALARIIVEK